jgi:hypothetical protein
MAALSRWVKTNPNLSKQAYFLLCVLVSWCFTNDFSPQRHQDTKKNSFQDLRLDRAGI